MLELETEIKSKVQKSLCACLRRTGLSSLSKIQSVICYIKYMLGLIQKKITTSLVSQVSRINNMWKKKSQQKPRSGVSLHLVSHISIKLLDYDKTHDA